jgi:hypothetical protein
MLVFSDRCEECEYSGITGGIFKQKVVVQIETFTDEPKQTPMDGPKAQASQIRAYWIC